MIKQRIQWLDQLRGIAMFMVVLGHVALPKETISLIYSFHMPLFFIISGMTLNDKKLMDAPIIPFIKDKAKKLIIPYFWMNFLMFPLWYITFKKITTVDTTLFQVIKGIFYGNNVEYYSAPSNALWFLPVLFFANVLYLLIIKASKNDETKTFVLVGICAFVGYLENGIAQIWHFNVTFTAVAFMYIGRCFMKLYREKREWFERKVNKEKYLLIALLLLIGWFTHEQNGRISMTANKFGHSFALYYLSAIAFSFAIILVVIMLPNIRLLSYCGKNTLLYVGVHIPIIRIFEKSFPEIFSQTGYAVLLAIGVYFVMLGICAFFNKAFPYVCAKEAEKKGTLYFIGKVFAVLCASIIPVLAIFQSLRLFSSQTVEKTVIVAVSLVFSVVFVILTSRYVPSIYFEKPKKN